MSFCECCLCWMLVVIFFAKGGATQSLMVLWCFLRFFLMCFGLFWMFVGLKMSTIFCFPTALTVYEVDFLILDLDGFKTGNHSGLFWKIPCQKVGCSTQILCNHQISCFKAMLDIFLVKKKRSPQVIFFLAILYLRMNFFLSYIFPSFWAHLVAAPGVDLFLRHVWTCFMDTTYILLGGAKRLFQFFTKKKFYFLKKKKREKTQKKRKETKSKFFRIIHTFNFENRSDHH